MRAQHDPIINSYESELGSYVKYVFYKDSSLLYQLKYYPLYQLAMISLFILVAYVIFSLSRRYEQDYVWVGMAKETAHQLGTPISSLVAWHQLLSAEPDANREILDELLLDVNRLELITERFSKIGSVPDLEHCNIRETLESALAYLRTRSSDKVSFTVIHPEEELEAQINTALFNWVIENLAKNAIDAMAGAGQIQVDVFRRGAKIVIDFSDTGKGISASQKGNVFKPGYSTKKRGWGLGLTLVKRIVENYHHGKIFVKQSVLGKGTTFRIILPEATNQHVSRS
jgi:signal transduction histidine kinase